MMAGKTTKKNINSPFTLSITVPLFLIVVLLLVFSTPSHASQKSLVRAYQKVTYSLKGGRMQFVCDHGLTTYRLVSSYGTRAKLYWQANLNEWVELDDVIYFDTNMSFEGVGKDGGIPTEEFTKHIHLPIFNDNYSNIPSRYFYQTSKTEHIPYIFIVDVIQNEITATNAEGITVRLMFDQRKYLLEQAFRTSTPAITAAQRLQQRTEEQRHQQKLIEAAEQFSKGITVSIPPYQYKYSNTCYLQ